MKRHLLSLSAAVIAGTPLVAAIQQARKNLVVNLRVAKTLGMMPLRTLLAAAGEAIE